MGDPSVDRGFAGLPLEYNRPIVPVPRHDQGPRRRGVNNPEMEGLIVTDDHRVSLDRLGRKHDGVCFCWEYIRRGPTVENEAHLDPAPIFDTDTHPGVTADASGDRDHTKRSNYRDQRRASTGRRHRLAPEVPRHRAPNAATAPTISRWCRNPPTPVIRCPPAREQCAHS